MPEPSQTLNYQSPRNISPLTRFLNRLPRPSLITIILILLTAASTYWLNIDHDPWVITRQFPGFLPRNDPKSAISPDGTKLLAILPDGQTIRIYDIPTGNTLRDLHRPAGEVTTAHFSPDTTRIWSIGTDDQALLWDTTTGKILATLPTNEFLAARASPFSGDSHWVAFCDQRLLLVYDARTGARINEIATKVGVAYPVFSPDSHYLAAAGYHPDDVWIWETKTWQIAAIITAGDGFMGTGSGGVEFAPDSKSLAVAIPPGVAIWDAATNRSARAFAVPGGQAQGCTYAPDGRYLLTFDNNGPEQIWDLTTRILAGNLRGGADSVSPDTRRIAVMSGGGTEMQSFPALTPLATVPYFQRMAWLPDSQSYISQDFPFNNRGIRDHPISLVHRRRPEAAFGLLYLPQSWLTLALAAAALYSILRDLKSWRRNPHRPAYVAP